MILPEYSSLKEKIKYFQAGAECINTEAELHWVVKKLEQYTHENFVFRGVNKAKYKLYNSRQRKFLQQGLASK